MDILTSKKISAVIVVTTLVVVLVIVHIQTDFGTQLAKTVNELRRNGPAMAPCDNEDKSEVYIQQRNMVSKQLNEMKKVYGQQNCEFIKYRAKKGEKIQSGVSANGGWCAELSGADSPSHMWDKSFSTALSKFLKGKVVGSFGDGPGMYKKHMDEVKEVKNYTAYDGAPYCETTTEGRVQFLDLTAPQYGLPAFEWVVSFEVGEHIPKQYQDVFVDNLVRHATEGIILSWAVPGQGGLSHVNNRPLQDVVDSMRQRYFSIDIEAGKPLRNAARFSWLKNNVHVYRRLDQSTFKPKDT